MGSGKPAVVIQPIDFDVATRAIDKFSHERKIPSMVVAPPAEQERGADALPAASGEPAPAETRKRRSIQRIPVELPDYAFQDLKRRALDNRCSARHIVMKALRAYGIHIDDEDMPEDGRRLR
jgi:hypothetical protein